MDLDRTQQYRIREWARKTLHTHRYEGQDGPLKEKGNALLNSGKYNQSIAYFDKALTINPNDVMALNSKGLALYRLGEYNGSISYFNKALAINRNLIIATKEKEATIAGVAHNMEPNIAKNR